MFSQKVLVETLFQEAGGGGGGRKVNESRERRLEKDRQTEKERMKEGKKRRVKALPSFVSSFLF